MSRRCLYAVSFFFVIAIFPGISFANHESPTIFVKNIVDQCLDILRSEKSKDIQKEKILNLMKGSFDFPSITENLLNGLNASDEDKTVFNDIFPLLLEKRYSVFVKSPDSLFVEYKGQELFNSGSEAIVHTRAKISSNEMYLDYKLRHFGGKWKILDITLGGVSLVGNYRAQIQKNLTQMSFPDFLIYLEKVSR